MANKTAIEKTQSHFPLAGLASDGWSTEDEATATCFCGTVQLSFPTSAPGLVDSFVCNCADCHKITASMFASNFTVDNAYLKHLRGQERLSVFGQSKTVARGHKMTNYFCSVCGTLMYRVGEGFPGQSILRNGTVDDFALHETKLRPRKKLFVKDRVAWFTGVEGVEKFEGMGA
ncbi:Mss4-like protein [Schizophyllum commune]